MGILRIVQLLLVGSLFVLTLFGVVYFRYLVDKALQVLGRSWTHVVVSVVAWIAPAMVSVYLGWVILTVTKDMESVYYMVGIHLVLGYLGSLLVRELVIMREVS